MFMCKFVGVHHFDFTNEQGKHITGDNVIVFNPVNSSILKCKLVNPSILDGIKYGDDVDVNITLNGSKVKFEV